MKTTAKRYLSILVSLFLMLGLFPGAPVSVRAAEAVCRIQEGGVTYASLAEALALVPSGGTITLLHDVDEDAGIHVNGKSVTIDMGGCSINLNTSAIEVSNNGFLTLRNGIAIYAKYINVSGGTLSATAHRVVTRSGITANTGGVVTINGTLSSTDLHAVSASDNGTFVNISGNISVVANSAYDSHVAGVRAEKSALVTVTGNVSVSGDCGMYGIAAYSNALITVTGNIIAPYGVSALSAHNDGIIVNGSIDSSLHCVQAEDSNVTINGNLICDDIAIAVSDQSEVTVNGTIRIYDRYYITIFDESGAALIVRYLLDDSNTSKPGYLGYSNVDHKHPSVVWVKSSLTLSGVALTIPVPAAGQKMSFDITSANPNAAPYLDQWTNITDNKIMTGSDVFEEGKTYHCYGIVYPLNGYSFKANDEKAITVNGKSAMEYGHIGADNVAFRQAFTIPLSPTPPPVILPFTDVSKTDWYYEAVKYVYANDLMYGTSAERFGPSTILTRAMVVTILYRHAGSPNVSAIANPFNDVAAGLWYTDAVKWAANNGVVAGYGNGKFGPNDPVTKEQLAAIIYRVQRAEGEIPPSTGAAKNFSDATSVTSWAKEAVNTLNKQGIFSDMPGNVFGPQTASNRAEVASVLHRWLISK